MQGEGAPEYRRWYRFGTWLVVGLVAAVLSSCVYFNTFYNAKKYFRQAEKARKEFDQEQTGRALNPRARHAYEGLYEKAVRKASLVLEKHRESELVDDAMFLIGRALYWKRDYQYASRSLQDLEDNFPESEYLDRARYWRALCLDGLSRDDEARTLFRSLMSDRRPTVGALAGLHLGDMSDRDQDWGGAIQQYQTTLETYPEAEIASQLWLRIGRAHMQLEEPARLDSALSAFDAALDANPPDSVEYRARLSRGQALYAKGENEAALDVYEDLLGEGRFRGWEGETRLLIGDYHRDRGNLTQALAEFEQIRDDFPQTDVSAQALYETGALYLQEEGDRLLATEYLEEVSKEKKGSIADSLAGVLMKTFTQLDDLLETVFEADSLAAAKIRPMVSVAPEAPADSILIVSDLADTVPGTIPDTKPVAVIDSMVSTAAIGVVPDTSLSEVGDTLLTGTPLADTIPIDTADASADTTAQEPAIAWQDTASYLPLFDESGIWVPLATRPSLREGEDEDADAARQRRNREARQRRSARARQGKQETLEDQLFTVAELYRDGLGLADSAAHYYGILTERFPASPHVPRALWNLAWVHSNLRDDSVAAEPPMQRLIQQYPTSVHAGAARQAMGLEAIDSAEDLAAGQFVRLENHLLHEQGNVDAWLPGLDSLILNYPLTVTAAQASFVVARALESVQPQDSVAIEARYDRIADVYGHTRYGELVRQRKQSRRDGAIARLERELQRLSEGTRPGERLTLLAKEPTEEDTTGFSRKFLSLGMRALRRGQYERATEWFELSLEERESRNGQAHAGLGEAAWRQSYYDDAIEHFRTGLGESGQAIYSYYRLFEYHVREDQADSANHYLREAVRRDRENYATQRLVDRFPTLTRGQPEEVEIADLETIQIEPSEEAFTLSAGFFGIVEEPFVQESVQPLYPAEASGDSAEVIIDVLINENGDPDLVDLFSGEEPFASAAVAAVKRYRFYAAEGPNTRLMPVWVELVLMLKPPTMTSPDPMADTGGSGESPE
ncbi:MAG: tetratricopeptide repeat protein [Gemmatimonadetes bacterium]|nr:tetratricopeptide repeat protein [Gemmatimonadota bacterium]MBT7861511.1 tetratricopeptide repeat protein [Gemmatimonadota bacterium]